ncbi:carbohydrate ABC transporter permease [Modestobacter sp. Leaf380]|uniref:carbohydrate ABC transporter permease n=1 Tax=Modestobacter sp. Leaf380 TaxID=1736356 RepID=UPI0009E7A22C|nr:sugar ABC transporter permease [Modestobacter sp. Leaf380]
MTAVPAPAGGLGNAPARGPGGVVAPRLTRSRGSSRAGQGRAAWAFTGPGLVLIGLFVLVPILMAFWVSLTDWRGRGSPFSSAVGFVGLDNYATILTEPGLPRQDFMTALRNNGWYVLLVVPLQTAIALGLAVVLNSRIRAKSFFRTAFYFPTVTSSVAISLVFIFLFTGGGAVNGLLGLVGIDGPNWFSDSRGLVHLLGDGVGLWDAGNPPAALTDGGPLGLSWWDWLSGPSIALAALIVLVVWTSAGGYMLMFLAALQDVPKDVQEAAVMDGANPWQRFRAVTLPALKPTLFLVITLGLIGTWQVFDQVYLISQGNPAKTTLTPAYLSYTSAFETGQWGRAAAMSFVLFAIIIVLTSVQRFVMRDKDAIAEKKAARAVARRSPSKTTFFHAGQ